MYRAVFAGLAFANVATADMCSDCKNFAQRAPKQGKMSIIECNEQCNQEGKLGKYCPNLCALVHTYPPDNCCTDAKLWNRAEGAPCDTASGFAAVMEFFDFEPIAALSNGTTSGGAVITMYKDSSDCSGTGAPRGPFVGCMSIIDARTGQPAPTGSITATCVNGGKNVDNVLFDSLDCSGPKQPQPRMATDTCYPQGGTMKPSFKWTCSGEGSNEDVVV